MTRCSGYTKCCFADLLTNLDLSTLDTAKCATTSIDCQLTANSNVGILFKNDVISEVCKEKAKRRFSGGKSVDILLAYLVTYVGLLGYCL